MKKVLTIFILVAGSCALSAQNFWQDFPHLNSRREAGPWAKSFVVAEGFANYGCDGVNNEFLNSLYKGGYLDSTFIENSTASLLPTNRFGVTTTTGITYGQNVNDSSREVFSISALRRNSITGRFSDDAFRLAFQGNTRFKGEEADFSRTRFTSMSWSELRFGYTTPHPNSVIRFSFALLVGHNYNQADVEYGKLFTDSQGLNVIGSVSGDYWSSDTANTTAFAMNGMGTSVDINWMWYDSLRSHEFQIVRVDLIDFGFINWNNNTIHRYVDTSFSWNGVDVTPYFFDPNYVAELPEENDFIKSDTTEFHRSIFLPAVARASYSQTFFYSKLIARVTLAMPLWSEALPFGSMTASWQPKKVKMAVTGGVAYGGYARTQVPLKLEYYGIPQFSIEAGTTNALAFIDPADFAGSGAFVKLTYCFR